MERYVDGFVLPIPKKNLAEYKKMASEAGKIWIRHGALEYLECVGEDLEPDMGEMKFISFPKLAKTKEEETVIFAFIIFKSRAHRDKVNAKVMADPSMNDPAWKEMPMPFDVNRMAYGGFNSLIDLKSKES